MFGTQPEIVYLNSYFKVATSSCIQRVIRAKKDVKIVLHTLGALRYAQGTIRFKAALT